ncbi:MAG TPA: hypothetical protein DD723_04145 [Candidatus Omnitrophica bacterium]|nr:MAG: hypothetical protein A2Z81_00155 [Omnitrophica WOR_2 bacterium GWA2_45_18]HBR14722.1 hypothetical protein [Candidatus Omnitrophota bacterium]
MNKHNIFLPSMMKRSLMMLSIVLLPLMMQTSLNAEVHTKGKTSNFLKFAKGKFIVKFKDSDECVQCLLTGATLPQNSKLKSITALNRKYNVKMNKSLFFKREGLSDVEARDKQNQLFQDVKEKYSHRAKKSQDASPPNLSNVYLFDVAEESDIEKVVQEFQADANVEYAQPDYVMEAEMTANDPLYNDLWGMKKIQADLAWDTAQGDGVVVAVVDTGVDYDHQDLAANMWVNLFETENGLDDDGNGYVDDVKGWNFVSSTNDPLDGNSHGTHVAGTIAAVGNNALGVIGVAPQATIMPVKGLDDAGSGYSSNLGKGIIYAAMNGADVINNSWGCASACPSNYWVEDAVKTAHGLGSVVVFAAGNSNDDAGQYSPQNMRQPIVVAASTSSDERAAYSNFGAGIDVTAPGSGIYSTIPGDQYGVKGGTSMAAPHVSGLAALILSHHPEFNQEDVRQAMQVSADDLGDPGFDTLTGHGRVNAFNVLQINAVVHPGISHPAFNQLFTVNGDTRVSVDGTIDGANFNHFTLEYKSMEKIQDWRTAEVPVDNQTSGTLGSVTLTDLPSSTYLLKLSAKDFYGAEFDEVTQFRVDNPAAGPLLHDPVFDSMPLSYTVPVGTTLSFTVRATDVDGDDLHLMIWATVPKGANYSIVSEEVLTDGSSRITGSFVWKPGSRQIGSYSLQFAVSDQPPFGNIVESDTVTVNVVQAPSTGGGGKGKR